MSPPPAVQTSGLVKRFPREQDWRSIWRRRWDKLALDGVDLRIESGEIFGLLGPNGAGKTTLIKILSTLLLPTEGQAFVAGFNVVEDSLKVRQQLGLIYGDERTFHWRLSAAENLRFYAGLHGLAGPVAERRIGELLELVGLGRDGHRPMHHFSSGMKQRTAIARGLLNDPGVLLMDEPTRSLDPVAAGEVRNLIRSRVAERGRAVLLATHQIQEAEILCDRVAFINHGRIELVGSVDELRHVLRSDEAHRILVSAANGHNFDDISKVPGVRSVTVTPMIDSTYQLDLNIRRGSAALPQVIRFLVESGGDVWSSTRRELSLEEIFAIAIQGEAKRATKSQEQGASI